MADIRRKVYIRADGSPEIGLGHLVRCIALAHMLQEAFLITFISKEIPDSLIAELNKNNFQLKIISSEEDFFKLLSGDEIVLLDHYGLDSEYQKEIKKKGSKLVCIDDIHDKEFFADLVINHSPGISPENYQAQKYTKFALGPEYALLRPCFLEAAKLKKDFLEVNKVMICFGGSDFQNLTASVLTVVKNIKEIKEVTVILGAAYPHKESIDAIAHGESRIRVLSSLNEESMLSEIRSADISIIPSSGILYEVIAAGSFPIICYYAENQKKFFNYFKERELVPSFNALEFYPDKLRVIITSILNQKEIIGEIPLRKEIAESSSNHLTNFKQLIHG
ncbi:UDP-2,4-diacetamido-2,4,6-trideoxy-beta-L-altropyranose hydrolase [Salinimicrobium sp. TH3]|uniref:UDP-2,4-diacetamido-2,4, 6-trideoxy-beta-L-altropyranose hydrolase n=1 Tax=Salinimicrobium sp. TH3 TaxID=2997342 RepID=UPI00227441C1|nr:UDP-2,4-diacetamido-2,4,6-trideoxy-beta-L-altropyranose hydrolase [Salinimicrobium sp. TH3]MCY2686954.1 UDP-2,4-diacetamido-2,4,6-trideoxy-beta-L-altropyranose hydrolase [Salinimicrobium sp. TH3]